MQACRMPPNSTSWDVGGGDHYICAHGDALFTVPKPLGVMGMGVDALPEDIRTSRVLTGNHLAMLGGAETMPDETEVNEHKPWKNWQKCSWTTRTTEQPWSRRCITWQLNFWRRAWWMKRGKPSAFNAG